MKKPNYRGWIFTDKVAIYTHYGEPLYGGVIGLAEIPLLYAIKNNLKLIVKSKLGTATYDNPKIWLKEKTGKANFKKKEPMKLYFRNILLDIKKREERKKLEKRINDSKGDVLFSVLEKMKEKQPELFEELKRKINTS